MIFYRSTKTFMFIWFFMCNSSFANNTKRTIWSYRVIDNELKNREIQLQQSLMNKLDEVILYISKNDLKSANAVLTAIKAKSPYRSPELLYIDAYLDYRLKRFDSSLRSLKSIKVPNSESQVKRCYLWLKIAWETKRWQEVSASFKSCESTLSHYSIDELFYTKNLINFSSNTINEQNVVPSPFFYFYAPDYSKIEQWLSLLIKKDLEVVAIKHLQRIPDDSLNQGNVRLLTAMALWNAQDYEYAQALIEKIPLNQRDNWNLKRLLTAVALSKKNWQLAWDSNREVLNEKPHLTSSLSLDLLLSWKMDLIQFLSLSKITNKIYLAEDKEITPLVATVLNLRGLKKESHELLEQYRPYLTDSPSHHLGYWAVKQWISIKGNDTAILMKDALDSCQKNISFGCWLLISAEKETKLDLERLFPYDSVGEYFRENL